MFVFILLLILTTALLTITLMPLKYQAEIDELGLHNCPPNAQSPKEKIETFRFSFEPIEHPYNMLPNIILDKIKKRLHIYNRYNSEVKCKRCGCSCYTTLNTASESWNDLPIQVKENLGYTHIAHGFLEPNDGLVSKIEESGHFTFYQNEDTTPEKNFKNIMPL